MQLDVLLECFLNATKAQIESPVFELFHVCASFVRLCGTYTTLDFTQHVPLGSIPFDGRVPALDCT